MLSTFFNFGEKNEFYNLTVIQILKYQELLLQHREGGKHGPLRRLPVSKVGSKVSAGVALQRGGVQVLLRPGQRKSQNVTRRTEQCQAHHTYRRSIDTVN